jgi:hypothetical protein
MLIPSRLYVVSKQCLKEIRPSDYLIGGRVAFMVDDDYLQLEIDIAREQWPKAPLFIHTINTSDCESLGMIKDGKLVVWYSRQAVRVSARQKLLG